MAVILAAILIDSNGIYLLGLLFALLAGAELQNLCCGNTRSTIGRVAKFMTVTGTIGLFALIVLPVVSIWPSGTFSLFVKNLLTYLAIAGIVAVPLRFLLTLYDKEAGALQRFAYSALCWVYIALPLVCMSTSGEGPLAWRVPLMLFLMIWLNDTGAYCVGSLCGKHRLFERLSPKKSWEGFWGGLVFSVLAGVVFALLSYSICAQHYYLTMSKGLYVATWGFTGAAISVAATWGDLFESLIKRSIGVKDSGHLIPGHGGILDRIDSLLFAAPVMLVIQIFIFG